MTKLSNTLQDYDPQKKYLLAVSGGIDSVVLLELFASQIPKQNLLVTHFDHGIRASSDVDAEFVTKLAKSHDIVIKTERKSLGPKASEEAARQARYQFLFATLQASGFDYLVTAHHQDDVVETLVLNILRGTGQAGLEGIKETETIKRPFLNLTKADILAYAKAHDLQWHEDETNQDLDYRRNFVRHQLLPFIIKQNAGLRQQLLRGAAEAQARERDLDDTYKNLLTGDRQSWPRSIFILPDYEAARELLHYLIRGLGQSRDIERRTLDELLVFIRTARVGAQFGWGERVFQVDTQEICLV